jgi:hypothetical protein
LRTMEAAMSDPLDLEALRKLLEAATPVKWWLPRGDRTMTDVHADCDQAMVECPRCGLWCCGPGERHTADHLKRALAAEARALEAERRLKDLAAQVQHFHGLMEGVELRFDMHERLRELDLCARALSSPAAGSEKP